MFYLTMYATHFIYGYMVSDIWLRTILIAREETRLTARVLLSAPSHRQGSTYHDFCYTSHGALAGMRNSSMGPLHEGSIRRPIAPGVNALPLSYVPHTTAFITPVVEHWLKREIAQWVLSMKDRSDDPSHHERTLYP